MFLPKIRQVVEGLGGDGNVTDVSVASFRPLFPSPRPTQESLLLQSSLAAALWGLRKLEEMGPAPWLALLSASGAARARRLARREEEATEGAAVAPGEDAPGEVEGFQLVGEG